MGVGNVKLTLSIIVLISASFLLEKSHGGNACNFPAIFNFGDSNSDTGSASAALARKPPPCGITWPGKPAGRLCDGRLIIDFYAEKLGLPYLNGYLDSIGTNLRSGASFAIGGATITKPSDNQIGSLPIQLNQFKEFVNRTQELYAEKGDNLPKPEDFSKALYTIDIGHNDIVARHNDIVSKKDADAIPRLLKTIANTLKTIYDTGGRTFWIHSTGPLGCLPYIVTGELTKNLAKDEIGCVTSVNEVAQEFNKQLKELVSQQRSQFKDATFTYVDVYTPKYSLFKDGNKHGFKDIHDYCCKHPVANKSCSDVEFDPIKGTPIYASCDKPKEYIAFDNAHFTEAANQLVANRVMDGSLSDPPLPLTEACNKFDSPKTEL